MTTKHQVRERTNYAVKLLLLGHSTSVVVGKVAEREGCSRRTAGIARVQGESASAGA